MSDKPKLIPFGTFYMKGKDLEIMVTTADKNGEGYLYAELPDAVFGFKNAKITYPNLVIEEREGFTDEEMAWIVQLLRDNKKFILEIAKEGIVYA